MPDFLKGIFTRAASPSSGGIAPVNTFEGITSTGHVVVRDRRGTRRAQIPNVDAKSETLGSDALAIYKPSGAKAVDAAKAMANFTGWTYAAVNAIAREVSNIEFLLYQVTGDNHEEQLEHPLLELLDGANDHMTGIELKYVTMAHLELTGNAYWLLDGVMDANTPPRAIYPLDPGRVNVKLDKSSFPYKLSHYEFTIDGKVFTFQPYQIVHLKYPDPRDPFVGIGIPQAIPAWIDSDNYAMEYNRKYFINGAGIGLYLATQTNAEGQIDRIKQSWKDNYSGVENAYKTPVLPKGVDIKNAGVTHRDMEFEKLAEATRDRILAAFGVSKTILGTAESDTNRATSETADYVFSRRTIKPKLLLIVSYLNEFLVPRYGDDLYLTFIDPTPEDKAARNQEMQAAIGNMPVMTQNEARRSYLGLGPIDGGDKLLMPTTMTEAGTTTTPEGEDVAPALAKTAEGWTTRSVRLRYGGKRSTRSIRKLFTEAFERAFDTAPQYQFKTIGELTHTEYMEHWKRFADRSEKAEAELRSVFDEINAKQKAEVIANLPDVLKTEGGSKRTVKGSIKALTDLFDPQEWIGITINLATPILTQLAKDEATAALAMIGAQHQDILADQATREALDQGISKMARSYTETTLDQLKKVLGEKLTQEGGTNLKELTDAVDGVYSFADERRAGLIAKTESYRAANWANREAWAQSSVVRTLIWYTAEDDRVCAYCQELDGTEVGIEDKFFNDTYTDGETPPRHPDCFTEDTVIVSPDAEQVMRMPYSGDVIELSFADGSKVSVTPNHPILTTRGFVAARLLKQGDQALKALLDDRVVDGRPNHEDSPASIGEVFRALREARGMTTSAMPVSPEYFHGDAESGKGEIDIVSADGLLRDNLDPILPQPVRQALLNRTGITLKTLHGKSDASSVLLTLALAADGIVSGSGISEVLLGSAASHEYAVRLQSPANYTGRLQKALADGTSVDVQGLRDAQLSLTGIVTTNDVIGIERKSFHGYVYDVSAMSTVYTANGLLTSNCRCYIRPGDISME